MDYTQERDKWFKGIDEFALEMKKKVSDKINIVIEDCMVRLKEKRSILEETQSKPQQGQELSKLINLKISEMFGEDEVGVGLTCYKLWDLKRKEAELRKEGEKNK